MSKHTPGPWRVAGTMGDRIRGANNLQIGLALSDDGEVPEAEWRANCALFAAAPELLEALKAILAAPVFHQSEELALALRQATIAIAKAEGGKP